MVESPPSVDLLCRWLILSLQLKSKTERSKLNVLTASARVPGYPVRLQNHSMSTWQASNSQSMLCDPFTLNRKELCSIVFCGEAQTRMELPIGSICASSGRER